MTSEDDSAGKKALNVHDLLKYNPQKPRVSQILKNIEQAKQHDHKKNMSFTDNDETKLPVVSQRSRHDLDIKKVDESTTKKPPQILAPLKSNDNLTTLYCKENSEMFAATGQRLAVLESTCRNQREEIKAKSVLIERLNKEASENKKNYEEEVKALKVRNQELKEILAKMLNYVEKKGLNWQEDIKNFNDEHEAVDKSNEADKDEQDDESDDAEEDKGEEVEEEKYEAERNEQESYVDQNKASKKLPIVVKDFGKNSLSVKERLPKEIDINLIKKRVQDLNCLIEGEHEIVKDVGGAYKFKKRDPISFELYKDGIKIEGYPFYKYSENAAQFILEDVLDGYFPSILKDKYPEGISFDLISFIDKTGDEIDRSPELQQRGRLENNITRSSGSKSGYSMSPERNRPTKPYKSPQTQHEHTEISTLNYTSKALDASDPSVTILKIRTETGKKTIVLKALINDYINTIYDCIRDHSETSSFELWGGYPPQKYSEADVKTLEELEIFGETVFNLRSKIS